MSGRALGEVLDAVDGTVGFGTIGDGGNEMITHGGGVEERRDLELGCGRPRGGTRHSVSQGTAHREVVPDLIQLAVATTEGDWKPMRGCFDGVLEFRQVIAAVVAGYNASLGEDGKGVERAKQARGLDEII